MTLLEMRDLRVSFGHLRAVDGVSLRIEAGKTLCLVGESGCGKSVTALSVGRLLPEPAQVQGEILFQGRDILKLNSAKLRALRGGGVSYVFQDPGASLNPVLRVGAQILEGLKLHRPEHANAAEVIRLLKLVGIAAPGERMRDYPHQLSGGMQQRVMLAMALASQPSLLVADEPTTALDVTIQAQIIELLVELQARLGMALLLITHNLGLVGNLADRVAVMYAGQIVEEAPAQDLLRRPCHPYTRALLRAVPELGQMRERLTAIPGNVPSLGRWPEGCRFAPRCPIARPECSHQMPALETVAENRQVRCPYWNG